MSLLRKHEIISEQGNTLDINNKGEALISLNTDAFGRLRVSNPTTVFDAQLTYDLQPLLFEQLITNSTIVHDTVNRSALMTFTSAPASSQAIMQTYEHFRYQPSKSQLIFITFNLIGQVANCLKFAGYSDGSNGFEFRNNGTTNQVAILSTTDSGNQIIDQPNWNLDKLDGTGISGKTLNIGTTNILVIDFQALYVGRVRFGFSIDGVIIYCHEFLNANSLLVPYVTSANLPIRVGMTTSNTVTTTLRYICSAVSSEGGQEDTASYDFAQGNSVTANNAVRTHLLTLRPKTLFNGLTNRTKIGFIELEILVTGNSSVEWELCLGQALTGTTYNDVNTSYSSVEYTNVGTLSGTPALIINRGYVPATNNSKSSSDRKINSRFPITLDAAGLNRLLGQLTLVVTGLGGNTATRGTIKWKEIR